MNINRFFFFSVFIGLLLLIASACSDIPTEVADTLDNAGDNSAELQKVIDHYKSIGDEEKLQAEYFLLKDIKYKTIKKVS